MHNAPQKSVVIVDDETSYTSLLMQLLSDHLDCRILAFSRPLDALSALPGVNPGVIVTDYHMPQMNGVDFINRAAMVCPEVPFIMITGHPIGIINREELGKIMPLKTVLLKPFGWQKLGDEIVRLWPERDVALLRREAHPVSL